MLVHFREESPPEELDQFDAVTDREHGNANINITLGRRGDAPGRRHSQSAYIC
jgi:hypothetical protein